MKIIIYSILTFIFLYVSIAAQVFEFRHKDANGYTWLRHIKQTLIFEKVEGLND